MIEKLGMLGYYTGEHIDGYPHGNGKKFYLYEAVYCGQWAYGRWHGRGIYDYKGIKFELECKNGVPKKLLNSDGLFLGKNKEEGIIIPFTYKQEGEFFIEDISPKIDSKGNLYFAYYCHETKCLGFNGKIFSSRIEEILTFDHKDFKFFGELKAIKSSCGFAQLDYGFCTYIGFVDKAYPNGKGKITYNGIKISSNFILGKLNGNTTVQIKKTKIYLLYNKGIVSHEISITIDNTFQRFFIDINSKKITSDKENYIIGLESVILKCLSVIDTIHFIFETKGNYYSLIYSSLFKVKSVDFISRMMRKSLNWIEYEKQVFENKIDLIKITEGNQKFMGENNIGKGIIASNQEKYKGQVKNYQIHGYGALSLVDQFLYNGEYENGLKNGIGCCIYNNGYRYKGHWKDDKRHGLGYLFIENIVIYGKWDKDQIVEQKSINFTLELRDKF